MTTNSLTDRIPNSKDWFQSSPRPKTGRNLFSGGDGRPTATVSILAPSEDGAQRANALPSAGEQREFQSSPRPKTGRNR